MGAPFSDIGSPITAIYGSSTSPLSTSSIITLSRITDGLSNTMLTSEVIVGQGFDLRGFSWWFQGAAFESYLGPNSLSPDMMQDQGYCKYPFAEQPPLRGSRLDPFHHVGCAQPPSRQRERRHGRRQRSLHQELGEPRHLAGAQHHPGGRSDQRRRVLNVPGIFNLPVR